MLNNPLFEKYKQYQDDYNKYLERSKYYRYLYDLFKYVFFGGSIISIIILSATSQFSLYSDIIDVISQKTGAYFVYSLIIGIGGMYIFNSALNKIKIACNYESINFPFLHTYKAYLSLGDFISTNKKIDKDDCINNLKKTYKIIDDEWEIGSFPLVVYKFEEKFNFIKNDFKNALFFLLSDDVPKNNYNKAYELLITFAEFLNTQNETHLNMLYEFGIKTTIPEKPSKIYIFKSKINLYVQKHDIISLFVLIFVLCSITFYVGTRLNVELNTIFTAVVAVFLGSLNLYDRIKKWIS